MAPSSRWVCHPFIILKSTPKTNDKQRKGFLTFQNSEASIVDMGIYTHQGAHTGYCIDVLTNQLRPCPVSKLRL